MNHKDNIDHSILKFLGLRKTISSDLANRLKQVEAAPTSTGRTMLLKFLNGDNLSVGQSVKAYCCTCSGFYSDGRIDCENPLCPLYRFMPYGQARRTKTKRK